MRKFLCKFKSIKVIITIWCMVLLTYIVVNKLNEFIPLAEILATAPLVYCGVNVLQDKIFKGENNNDIKSDNEH